MSEDKKLTLLGCAAAAILLPACFGGCYAGSRVQVADGYRDSTVRKLSETGIVFKTWECETLGDGMRGSASKEGGATLAPETFQYTVRDPAVLAKLRDLPPGKRVRISYRKMLFAWQPNGESRYIVTGVDDAPPEAK